MCAGILAEPTRMPHVSSSVSHQSSCGSTRSVSCGVFGGLGRGRSDRACGFLDCGRQVTSAAARALDRDLSGAISEVEIVQLSEGAAIELNGLLGQVRLRKDGLFACSERSLGKLDSDPHSLRTPRLQLAPLQASRSALETRRADMLPRRDSAPGSFTQCPVSQPHG